MRVMLKVGVVEHWLAGKPGVSEREWSSVSDYRIEPQIEVQDSKRVRASEAKVHDRGNLKNTLTFGTTRKFETASEAEQFSNDYDTTAPRTGTLVLESVLPVGGVVRRYLPNAVVLPPRRQVIGCSVLLSYTAVGGAIKTTPN